MIGKTEWKIIGLIYIKVLKTEFDYGTNARDKEKEAIKPAFWAINNISGSHLWKWEEWG